MLKRIRLEVETDSPEQAVMELDRYEHALQTAEAERYCIGRDTDWQLLPWATPNDWRSFHNEELSREITEEVIQLEPGAGYLGRRVVHFRRLDTRKTPVDSGLPHLERHGWEPRWDDNPKVTRLHWTPGPGMTKKEALSESSPPRP